MEVNNLNTNRRAQIGNITIPLLKGEQGYSISRIVRTSGDGGAGSIDTYTVYIDTTPETAIGTFQVVNGTGGDMSKNVYDIDNDDIVDRATGDGNGNEITATYETIANVTALASRVATLEQAGYITKSVADLANYYLKSETYTKQEVNNLCDMIPKFAIEVVSVLPTQDISETTIYLLRDDEETQDVYQEYIYVNNTWERIGGQRIDLSNYYQKSETYSKDELNDKLVSVGAEAPENGERVWFSKSDNLFNNNVERKNAYVVNPGSIGQVVAYNNSSATYSFVNCCQVEQGKTYTISWEQNQTPASTNGRQGCIVDSNNIVKQYIVTWNHGGNYDTFTANANGFLILATDIYATNIQIYIERGIYVDNEQWFFNNYSISEQVIGRWIDGKPLYRKVVDIGTLPNATSKQVAHNISNMGLVVSVRGMAIDYRFLPVPFSATSNAYAISIFADATNITIMAGNDRSGATGFAIIEYTKTTD